MTLNLYVHGLSINFDVELLSMTCFSGQCACVPYVLYIELFTYKGMQPAKNGAMWCEKYSPGPFGSCATAVKEEEEEDETWEMSRALSICRRIFAVK